MSPRNEVLEAVKGELERYGVPYSVEIRRNNHLAVKFGQKFIHVVSASCSDRRAVKQAAALVRRDLRSINHPGL